jgi:predicted phosphodiesterase
MSLKADTARQYRTKFPEKPSLALARIIYKENKKLFKNVEDARDKLRYIEGKKGEKSRKEVAKTGFFLEQARPYNPYKLPDSNAKDIEPFVLKGHNRVFLLNDVHIPFHANEAITAAFDYAKKQKPDAVVLNGDILDCFQLSYFLKDPRQKDFAQELKLFKQFFEVMERTFKCKIYYKFGNHELRYEHYLFQKAGELVGVEEFELANIIKARAEGITVIGDKTIIKANSLSIIHGHETGRGMFNPVNTARSLHLKTNVTALQGDSHQTSEHTTTDLHGEIKTTWSVGALCGLHPKYLPYNKWNWGFAIIDLDQNRKDFNVHNKRIYKNKVL